MSARTPSPAGAGEPSAADAATWSRRRLLGAAVAVVAGAVAVPVLAACGGADGPATALATPPPDTVGTVLDRHRALRAAYTATATEYADLDPLVTPLRDELDEHITALEKAFAREDASDASGSAGSSGASAAPTPPVPPDPAAARTALQQAAQAAIPDLTALAGAVDAERAPLVGSVAASCACHVELLS